MLSGMLFQLIWNTVPTYLEQISILAVTRLELKKLTTRVYLARRERWRLEARRGGLVVVIGCGMDGLDSTKLISTVT